MVIIEGKNNCITNEEELSKLDNVRIIIKGNGNSIELENANRISEWGDSYL